MKKIPWTCCNCDKTQQHDEDELPNAWRWFGLTGTLDGGFDFDEAMLICATCVDAVLAALRVDAKAS